MYHRIGKSLKAIEVLEQLRAHHPADFDLTAVNILCELLIGQGLFSRALDVLESARASLLPADAQQADEGSNPSTADGCYMRSSGGGSSCGDGDRHSVGFPIDLLAKQAVCLVRTQRHEEAQVRHVKVLGALNITGGGYRIPLLFCVR